MFGYLFPGGFPSPASTEMPMGELASGAKRFARALSVSRSSAVLSATVVRVRTVSPSRFTRTRTASGFVVPEAGKPSE